MEDHFPPGRNLLNQLEIKGGRPRTATRPEYVEKFVVGNGDSEAAIENHRHRLTNYLHKAYVTLVPYHFRDQYHHLPGRLL